MDNDLEKLEQSSALEPSTAKQLAALETALSKEIDGRKEDRFFFAVIVLALFDVGAVAVAQSYLLIIPFLLELGFLGWFAKKMGVEEAVIWLERIEAAIGKLIDGGRK